MLLYRKNQITFHIKGMKVIMYLTIKETAEFLSLQEAYIENLIFEKRIRAIHDGNQYLINKEQFNDHLEQVEKYKKTILEYLSEPLPEDLDVKDED
jgi:excisionase family DNA binding protein